MAQNIKPAAQKPEDPTVPKKSSKKLVMGLLPLWWWSFLPARAGISAKATKQRM